MLPAGVHVFRRHKTERLARHPSGSCEPGVSQANQGIPRVATDPALRNRVLEAGVEVLAVDALDMSTLDHCPQERSLSAPQLESNDEGSQDRARGVLR